jgi:hypothetical protein
MPALVIENEVDREALVHTFRSRGWGFFEQVVRAQIADLTATLVDHNDEQLRGRIKGMREMLEQIPTKMLADSKSAIARKGDV